MCTLPMGARVRAPSAVLAVVLVALSGCADEPDDRSGGDAPGGTMRVTSAAYQEGGSIPSKYACDGADVTPPWNLHDVPEDAAALAAVFFDPDAPSGSWVHWLAWDIDPDERSWLEGTDGTDLGTVGANSWGNESYGGPCPPSGTHRYVLEVYALDEELGLPAGSDRAAFDDARDGHVLAEARLTGTYARSTG